MLKIVALDTYCPQPYQLYVFGVESEDGDDTIYVRHKERWHDGENRFSPRTPLWTTAYDCWTPSLDSPDIGAGISEEKYEWLDKVCAQMIGGSEMRGRKRKQAKEEEFPPMFHLLCQLDVLLAWKDRMPEDPRILEFEKYTVLPWGETLGLGRWAEERFATLLQTNVLRGVPEWLDLIRAPENQP